jgi:hypothetical protein
MPDAPKPTVRAVIKADLQAERAAVRADMQDHPFKTALLVAAFVALVVAAVAVGLSI